MTNTADKIAQANAYITDIEAVKSSLKTKFNIGDDVPFNQYPDLISPVTEGETVFYKAASSYYDPAVPAYKNIQISGMMNPSGGNGTWVNQRPDYAGFMRAWTNGNYMLSFVDNYWFIYTRGSTPSTYDSYFRAAVINSSENGSMSNPWIWDNYVSADRSITNGMDASSISYECGCFYVTLKAGTAYQFGLVSNITSGGIDYFYACLQPSGENYDELASGGIDSTGTINGQTCTNVMSYTPSTSGIYKFRVYGENYSAQGDIKYVCYPAPETWVEPSENPWDYTFEAVNGSGTLTMTLVDVAEHTATKTWAGYRVYKQTKSDGSVYYDYADTITEGLTWNRFAPNSGEVWNADATLRADYLDDGNKYPENATVWKIDVVANTKYAMSTGGGAGNIIDWGDGSQTTTQDGSINTKYSHTYTTAGTYYIQVIGDTVEWIHAEIDSSYRNAADVYNVKEAVQCSKSLLSCNGLFKCCRGLLKIADTFQLPRGMTDATEMLYCCSALIEAPESIRLPASCMSFEYFMSACAKLKVDVTHWFDDLVIGKNLNKNMSYAFSNCNSITGILPADKLWLDASWRNGGSKVDTRNTFAGCTKLSNYNDIAKSWING